MKLHKFPNEMEHMLAWISPSPLPNPLPSWAIQIFAQVSHEIHTEFYKCNELGICCFGFFVKILCAETVTKTNKEQT